MSATAGQPGRRARVAHRGRAGTTAPGHPVLTVVGRGVPGTPARRKVAPAPGTAAPHIIVPGQRTAVLTPRTAVRRRGVPGPGRDTVTPRHTPIPVRRAAGIPVPHAAGAARPVNGTAVRGRPVRARARLTRRGRIVVMILAVAGLLMVTGLAWILGAARADAAGSGGPAGSVYRHLASVVVKPGQNLWGIAMQADPNADPRSVIQQIIDVNALAGSSVQAGQRLWVPRG